MIKIPPAYAPLPTLAASPEQPAKSMSTTTKAFLWLAGAAIVGGVVIWALVGPKAAAATALLISPIPPP